MTLPEVLLWQTLRTRPGGFKFRRQHPCGPYVLDFYCEDASLAIEVDGLIHDSRQERDSERDAWLLARGIGTFRMAAAEVLADPEVTLIAILEICRARPLHHPPAAGGPPPLQGGA
jgi:very-short-patch-repair endonuclease